MTRRLVVPIIVALTCCAIAVAALHRTPEPTNTNSVEHAARTGGGRDRIRHAPTMAPGEAWGGQWIDVPADDVLPGGLKLEVTKGVITGVGTDPSVSKPDILGTRYVIGDIDATDVTEALWRNVSLTISKDDGSLTEIQLARPLWWISENYVVAGGELYLALYEMGIEGMAEVAAITPLAIESSPTQSDSSEFVTGTFKHRNATVWNLVFNNDDSDPLGVTANHPIFSGDRNEWVPAAELQHGEQVRTTNGTATLTSKQRNPGTHTVYNLEVHRSHTFYVHDLGILAHNTCAGDHHFVPRSLGSKTPYRHSSLTHLNQADHTRVHQSLNNFLRTKTKTLPNGKVVDMLPRRGNAGAVVRNNFTKQERLKALVDFYKGFDNGKYYQNFLAELKVATQKGWIQ